LRAIHALANDLEGQPVGPAEGPVTRYNHLRDELSAYFVVKELFVPQSVTVEGVTPRTPPPDPGVESKASTGIRRRIAALIRSITSLEEQKP
jgi:hypothetical protein